MHVAVGFLDLVEQDDAMGPRRQRIAERPALLEADVARRGADEPRDRVGLGVLAHVDPNEGVGAIEQRVGQRLGDLGLADPAGAEQEHRGDRAVAAEPGLVAADEIGESLEGSLVSHDALVQPSLELEQAMVVVAFDPRRGQATALDHDLDPRRAGDGALAFTHGSGAGEVQ